jgi:UDPglucose 6-dehydrogenase
VKICVVGSGYVGLVTGACLAEVGNFVVCIDRNSTRVARLKRGGIPFHEPGLKELVQRNRGEGRLSFASRLAAAADSDVYFIAVGTPATAAGSADISQVLDVASELGRRIQGPCTIVSKSTAPVGMAEKIRQAVRRELARRKRRIEFDVVSNPEFLKEGDAVNDFMRPDRVVIGADSKRAVKAMRLLFAPITRNHERLLVMGLRDAEMTKYAANAMLATRISLMNEIANICERLGVDVENVRTGIGSDNRIGYAFIYPGCGYGGSCLPKDIKALIDQARGFQLQPRILQAVDETNEKQKLRLYEKIRGRFGPKLRGREFGLWGLSFKPGTDDMRDAPSVALLEKLIAAGARVKAYDPVAMGAARRFLPPTWFRSGALRLARDQYAALKGVDALVLVTEWKPFRTPDFQRMKKGMRGAVIFDGRNQYDPELVRAAGFDYYGIGR